MSDNTNLATEQDNDPTLQFQGKIAERIRNDIGKLMPDELLQKMVADTIAAELNRPVDEDGSWSSKIPWIRKEIKSALGDKIQAAASTEILKRENEIKKMVAEEIKELIPGALAEVIMAMLKGQVSNLEYSVQNIMNNQRY